MTSRNVEDVKDEIIEKLENVIDPELGVDIVNLGLIYEIDLDSAGSCEIKMTLTTMGCPLTDVLAEMIERELQPIAEVKQVNINFVWEPAWTIDKMTRYAKMALGIH
ncbi:metal-sulfur cluster assembly factor [Liquorilactobacillus mali]|uniref:N-6 adenine-specific DNA methylase YitW n=1 Tax=Liquorilactobacillus mali TaxID=1618 RepID=A0A0R2FXQ8_9LACO|nr:metal-sulfur cluster assembly factor [Liquorilactobacillus mali]KRN33177.1 N-6 adenine-specific DNA methylase YitW [Liquorilactobacillus mali]MDN7145008.1 metal-sulfur cluster assembly factor [Liquorilactobacillus mali]